MKLKPLTALAALMASVSASAEVWTCSMEYSDKSKSGWAPEPITYVRTSEKEFISTEQSLDEDGESMTLVDKFEVAFEGYDKLELRGTGDGYTSQTTSVHLYLATKRAHQISTDGYYKNILHQTGLCEIQE